MPPFVGYFMVCSCICKVFVGYFHVCSVATNLMTRVSNRTATEVQAIRFGFHRIPPSVAASSVQDGAERAWHGLVSKRGISMAILIRKLGRNDLGSKF